jgi:sensor domain DACND-containing protein/sensor domain DACNH-containing protein/DisA checkpoint controller-like protein
MIAQNFITKCILDTAEGLRDGLCHFSPPSRVALIYAVNPGDPLRVYDPQHLLQGHEPKFKELFIDSDAWRGMMPPMISSRSFALIHNEEVPELAGLVSFGARSVSLFYQMWFTEHHPDMCSVGPTKRWLEHAAWRLSHDLANKDELYTGISGHFLREYETHAVRDYIIDEMNVQLGWDSRLRVFSILDVVLGISKTREEGAFPLGELIFVEPAHLKEVEFAARFPEMERPSIENFKHVRKLLQAVEHSTRKLVSDGNSIVGVASGALPEFCLIADFRGGRGFLKLSDKAVCSFSDGRFHSSTRRAKLVEVEEALIESHLGSEAAMSLFKTIAEIVHSAEKLKHGCTLVIDLNEQPVEISGQRLEPPLDLKDTDLLALAKSLAKVDGALHIGMDLKLNAFACLLDGSAIPGEDRARGARFNSALRFTHGRKNLMVVVVSSDRPVSMIQEGLELSARCAWNPVTGFISTPPALEQWLGEEGLGG